MPAMTSLTASPHFTLQQLAEGVYAAIHKDGGAAISNAGLVDMADRTIVFDSLLSPRAGRDLRRSAESVTGKPVALLVNSHYHNDHIWGNQEFDTSTTLIASEKTYHLIDSEGRAELDDALSRSAQQLQRMRAILETEKDEQRQEGLRHAVEYYSSLSESAPLIRMRLPDMTFESSLRLYGPQNSLELITFKDAHTASDTVLFLPQQRICFASDLLFVGLHPYLADGDPHGWLLALDELEKLDADQYVPGHGPTGGKQDLNLMRKYINTCLELAGRLDGDAQYLQQQVGEIAIPQPFAGWQMEAFFAQNLAALARRSSPDS